jgi:hypothetical protein
MCHVSVTVISEELEKKRHEGNNGYHFKQEECGTPKCACVYIEGDSKQEKEYMYLQAKDLL